MARHIANLVADVLQGLPQEDRGAAQTELTNQIIRLLAANPIEARPNDDLVENPPEQLLAIQPIGNLPNDERDLVAPLVALSASDLLVNARGEPGLAHALAHEVPSADSIDLLCAFVRWHGLRLLENQLEAHCRSGNLLGTERVVRVVDHDRGDLPSGVCFLQQVHDTVSLQLLPVGLATYGDAPGNHAGCAQPFKAKVG